MICGNCDQEIREDGQGEWTAVLSWSEGGSGTLCSSGFGDHAPAGLPSFRQVAEHHAEAWSIAMAHIWTIDALMDGPDVWHYYVPRELTTGPGVFPTLTVEITPLDPRVFAILFGQQAPCTCEYARAPRRSHDATNGLYAWDCWCRIYVFTINPGCLQHGDARREDDPRSW